MLATAIISSGIVPAVDKLPKPSDLIMGDQSTSTPEVKYLDHRNILTYLIRTLVLMADVQTVNSDPYAFLTVTSANAGTSGRFFADGFTPPNPYTRQHRYPTMLNHSVQPNPF